eukprot:scaffold47928_cov49-Phaeocystis_antarctica.AAC.6
MWCGPEVLVTETAVPSFSTNCQPAASAALRLPYLSTSAVRAADTCSIRGGGFGALVVVRGSGGGGGGGTW